MGCRSGIGRLAGHPIVLLKALSRKNNHPVNHLCYNYDNERFKSIRVELFEEIHLLGGLQDE